MAGAVKPGRRNMVLTGWAMTIIGISIVLFWSLYEAAVNFSNSPVGAIVGMLVVVGVLVLLVPVPLIGATRRARRPRR